MKITDRVIKTLSLLLMGFVPLPSVAQLPDGRLLILQDEGELPMGTLIPAENGQLVEQAIRYQNQVPAAGEAVKLNDLEGVTRKGDYLYAITSHSARKSGGRSEARERLVRFQIEGESIVDLKVAAGLVKAVIGRHAALKPLIPVLH